MIFKDLPPLNKCNHQNTKNLKNAAGLNCVNAVGKEYSSVSMTPTFYHYYYIPHGISKLNVTITQFQENENTPPLILPGI